MFIEVSEGISVNIESIQEVEATPLGCIVHTQRASYSSAFPYRLLLSLIEREEKVETPVVKLEPEVKNVLNSLGSFAG